jgi:FKBP-type peptidyl-prolyl cis-trans isomerase FkpA
VRPFRSTLAAAAVFIGLALAAACDETPTAPSNYAPFSQADLRVGTGAPAASGSTLRVNYTGWLYDASQPEQKGLQFETSAGREPLSFVLGTGGVIAGWEQGLVGMRPGGLRRLVIPPSLAYGAIRNGPIPPNATLVFEIELLDGQ